MVSQKKNNTSYKKRETHIHAPYIGLYDILYYLLFRFMLITTISYYIDRKIKSRFNKKTRGHWLAPKPLTYNVELNHYQIQSLPIRY